MRAAYPAATPTIWALNRFVTKDVNLPRKSRYVVPPWTPHV